MDTYTKRWLIAITSGVDNVPGQQLLNAAGNSKLPQLIRKARSRLSQRIHLSVQFVVSTPFLSCARTAQFALAGAVDQVDGKGGEVLVSQDADWDHNRSTLQQRHQ